MLSAMRKIPNIFVTPAFPSPGRPAAAGRSDAAKAAPDADTRPDGDAPAKSKGIHESPGVRKRLYQLFVDNKTVLYPPALQYPGNWAENAPAICADWIAEQARTIQLLPASSSRPATSSATHDLPPHVESACEFSRMLALAYEHKHRDELLQDHPEDLLISGGKNIRSRYNDEIVRAFLRAVGEDKVDEVVASFRRAGTGALHRQTVSISAAFTNILSALNLLIPDPASAIVVPAIRAGSHLVTAAAVAESGRRRLRNAGTEDVIPLGRVEAAGPAKNAPNLLQASKAAAWELHSVKKDLRKLDAALRELERIQTDAPTDEAALDNARDNLSVALARVCHRVAVKGRYKAARENVAVEFRGNERNLYTGTAGTLFTVIAGGIAVMSPEIVSSAASGGLLAGAATTALALYCIYQLSNLTEKDAEAKVRRAIEALIKLTEILDSEQDESTSRRAKAYEEYLKDRKRSPAVKAGSGNSTVPDPRQVLITKLNEITSSERKTRKQPAASDEAPGKGGNTERLTARQNWTRYHEHFAQTMKIENGPGSESEKRAELREARAQYYASHASALQTAPLVQGWSRQPRLKMNTARRLLRGKVAREHKRLLREKNASPKKFSQVDQHQQRVKQAENNLKQALRNLIHFEHACSRMEVGEDGQAVSDNNLKAAASSLAKIDDSDLHALYQGDAREQVDATLAARKFTEGEASRYTLLNIGANAVPMAVGGLVHMIDLQIIAAKEIGAYDGPRVLDFKLVNTLSINATPAAPLSTGDRTAFSKRQAEPLNRIIARRSKPSESAGEMHLPKTPLFQGGAKQGPTATEIAADHPSAISPRSADVLEIVEEPLGAMPSAQSIASLDMPAEDWSHWEAAFERVLEKQIDENVKVMSTMKYVPDALRLNFGSQAETQEDASVSSNGENSTVVEIDLKETAAYHRVNYKNASSLAKLKYMAGEVGIAAKQSALVFGGPIAQMAAQWPLKKTRAALNNAGERIAEADGALRGMEPSKRPRPASQRSGSQGSAQRQPSSPVSAGARQGEGRESSAPQLPGFSDMGPDLESLINMFSASATPADGPA